jgi:hypothetical protein
VVVWDDAGVNDLSNNGLAPTFVSMSVGENIIYGVLDYFSSSSIDRDYFSFAVPDNTVLAAVEVLGNTSLPPGTAVFAIQAGSAVTVSPDAPTANGLLGWLNWTNDATGTNILPSVGSGSNGSTGFVPPLPAGTYSVWLQTDSTFNNGAYGLSFTLAAVPEPAVYLLWVAGLLALASSRSQHSRAQLRRRLTPRST